MTLNRYRLQHLVKERHAGAVRAHRLLQRPDRLIGLLLLGNNFANILASS
ncbi:MAG: CNNM domain-containing protein, partial [Methylococcales bacterium]